MHDLTIADIILSMFATALAAFAAGFLVGNVGRRTKRVSPPATNGGPEISGIMRLILNANRDKHHSNLIRRIMKQMEELGEAAEAYLNVTSEGNGKGKTWADVREELADQVIVAVDCALTPTPDQIKANMTDAEIEAEFCATVGAKLLKWHNNRNTGKAATDAE